MMLFLCKLAALRTLSKIQNLPELYLEPSPPQASPEPIRNLSLAGTFPEHFTKPWTVKLAGSQNFARNFPHKFRTLNFPPEPPRPHLKPHYIEPFPLAFLKNDPTGQTRMLERTSTCTKHSTMGAHSRHKLGSGHRMASAWDTFNADDERWRKNTGQQGRKRTTEGPRPVF